MENGTNKTDTAKQQSMRRPTFIRYVWMTFVDDGSGDNNCANCDDRSTWSCTLCN